MNEILSNSQRLTVKRNNFILGYFFVSFNSETRMDPGIYDILSENAHIPLGA